MGDITDQHDQTSPPDVAESHSVGNGNSAPANEARGVKRQRPSAEDDDDDDEKGGRERRKIEIKFISDKSRRHITFSKRKAGIMKKVSCAPGEVLPSIHRRRRRDALLHHYRGLGPRLSRQLTNDSRRRPTSCRFSLARKYFFWSFRRPALFTHSRRRSSNR